MVNLSGMFNKAKRAVILAGGGAEFFKDVLDEKFPKHKIITAHDPVFANVRGCPIIRY